MDENACEAHAQPFAPKPDCVQSFTYVFALERRPQVERHVIARPARFAHFRAQRMRMECGPITDAELHAQCVDSFNGGGEPSVGSSTAPQNYSTGNGR